MRITYLQTDDDWDWDVFGSGPDGWVAWMDGNYEGFGLPLKTLNVTHVSQLPAGFHEYLVTAEGSPAAVAELLETFQPDETVVADGLQRRVADLSKELRTGAGKRGAAERST